MKLSSEGRRRIAAIMFTDIQGYTALTHADESLGIQLLNENRQILEPLFGGHNGRVVKTIGDAFLVEFGSAVDAVECAIEVQNTMRDRNESVGPGKVINLRIGIHLGDVVHQQGDILGDGVNIAARIEPLAESVGICLSRQVVDQVHNKLDARLLRLGVYQLKSISSPVEVYTIDLARSGMGRTESAEFDRRRIAVLPLTNMITDPGDEYFADGMTEELISTIGKIGDLTVISRTSVMKYKGARAQITEIGGELHVGSILEGSVRKAENRVRITAQLIDVRTDGQLWSQAYDRELSDVFAIQSEIAEQVAEALRVRLLSAEKKDIEKRATESTEAYKLYLKGRYFWNERTKAGMDKAVKYFEEAIQRDPAFALAYGGLADCYVVYPNYGWMRPKEASPSALQFSLKAIEIDPRLAEPHATLGLLHADFEHRWQEAEQEFRRAMELKPSYATAHHWYALVLRRVSRLEESYEQMMRGSDLDPLSRIIGVNLVEALYVLGRVKEAINESERVIEANRDFALAYLHLGWAYYLDNRTEDAISELRKSVALSGGDAYYRAELACLLGISGRRVEANEIIDELKGLAGIKYVNAGVMAFALFGAGRPDEAFGYLEKAYEERSDIMLNFIHRPWFSEARKDPRWASLEKRLGVHGI